ncbi:GTPase, partial [Escherichia coli]|nr:GTPase [Escherichia coli]MDY8809145.1 GTPase [Escherichia coli]MDY8859859.1 GTPase [Escherichia coli]
MNPSDAIEAIEKPLSSLPYSLSRHILEHLRKLTSHEPVIGIMGKSGAGKSSLCNALFQGEVTPVSDVHAGTREVRRFRLSGHGHSMIITDLPGVGESRDRDAEYEALYRDILPELDLVLWLIAKWHLNRSQFGIRIDHDLASISDHSLASQSITIWHA